MTPPWWPEIFRGFGLRLALEAVNRNSRMSRALRGSELPHDTQRIYARNLEVPSGGAVSTARGIAHAYSVFATGGRELKLRTETLDLLAAPAIPPMDPISRRADGATASPGIARSRRRS